jgi:hypothetical protein
MFDDKISSAGSDPATAALAGVTPPPLPELPI